MRPGVPLAVPVALRTVAGWPRSAAVGVAISAPTPSEEDLLVYRRGRYLTAARLSELDRRLSPRDRDILRTLGIVRVAGAGQLERLHFTGVSRRQQRKALASLTDRQLLGRLPRVVGGVRAGSAGYIYAIGPAGRRLLHPGEPRHRPWTVGAPFLAHSLAVTELYVRLVLAERAGHLQHVVFTTEPAAWRPFPGPGGGRRLLKPDAAVVVRLGRFEDRWFVEVDRGTESLPTVRRKCELYRRYWASGREQAACGVFPRVLWLVPDARRAHDLRQLLERWPTETRGLFMVSRFDDGVDRIAQGADQ